MPVDLGDTGAIGNRFHFGKPPFGEGQPGTVWGQIFSCGFDGFGVTVDGDDDAVRSIENGAGVATRAKSAIDIGTAGFGRERLNDLGQEDGNVTGRSASGRPKIGAATRHHSRPPSVSPLSAAPRAE